MGKFLSKFNTTADYEAALSSLATPHIAITKDNYEVHYISYVEPVETRVVAKFNVTDTNSSTKIADSSTVFSTIEIDGIEQQSVITEYPFSTAGEHTVKYTLTDPTNIGQRAFYMCSCLISITIPSGVTSIGTSTFQGCGSLTSINIPSSVTTISNNAFSNCRGLTSINIPNGVTTIGSSAFSYCSGFTSIEIPSSVKTIGMSAFNGCSGLTSINIPNGVTTIGGSAFAYCTNLISIDIPDSVTSIGGYSFCTNLKRLNSNVDGVFNIPNGVTSIGGTAFNKCESLTSITIPDSVTSIGAQAFYMCSGLTSIICNATTAPTVQNDTFQEIKTYGTLYVPIGSNGYNTWMGTGRYYLGKYNWTKIEQ